MDCYLHFIKKRGEGNSSTQLFLLFRQSIPRFIRWYHPQSAWFFPQLNLSGNDIIDFARSGFPNQIRLTMKISHYSILICLSVYLSIGVCFFRGLLNLDYQRPHLTPTGRPFSRVTRGISQNPILQHILEKMFWYFCLKHSFLLRFL